MSAPTIRRRVAAALTAIALLASAGGATPAFAQTHAGPHQPSQTHA
jgi:hypothetical protein